MRRFGVRLAHAARVDGKDDVSGLSQRLEIFIEQPLGGLSIFVDENGRRARRALLLGKKKHGGNIDLRLAVIDDLFEDEGPAIDARESARIEGRRPKMQGVTYRALNFRRNHEDLFAKGTYIPLTVKGCKAENVCAFARRHEDAWAITIAPRWYSRLAGEGAWQDTHIVLPEGAPDRWENTLTAAETGLELRETLASFPVALLFTS